MKIAWSGTHNTISHATAETIAFRIRNQWHLVDEFLGRVVVSPKIKPFSVSPVPRKQSETKGKQAMTDRDNSTRDKDLMLPIPRGGECSACMGQILLGKA